MTIGYCSRPIWKTEHNDEDNFESLLPQYQNLQKRLQAVCEHEETEDILFSKHGFTFAQTRCTSCDQIWQGKWIPVD